MRNYRLCLLSIAVFVACSLRAQTGVPRSHSDAAVTPVTGESWLRHLNRSFDDTSMGKTWRLGPATVAQEDASLSPLQVPTFSAYQPVLLRGSDLYRLNCRGCHGESGLGMPPEINSVISPVRATSVSLILERMKNVGMHISYRSAVELAQQSKALLLRRLHNGGEDMPAFPQLKETEIRALLEYLRQLADVPGSSGKQSVVAVSRVRVGELIVKSTCHTCHSAAGPDITAEDLQNGAIPALSTLTRRKSLPELVQKVTQGAPVLMGTPPQRCRGRMPVFDYLSQEEAADVYLYLKLYPPSEQSAPTPLTGVSQVLLASSSNGPERPRTSHPPDDKTLQNSESSEKADLQTSALAWAATFAVLLLAGAAVFTLRELNRLSAARAGHYPVRHNLVAVAEEVPRLSSTAVSGR